MERAVAEFRDNAHVGVGIDPDAGRDARIARLLAEREGGRQRHGILIDDERQLDDAALVSVRQFRRKGHWDQRRVVGALGRLERHEALVLYDLRVVEKHAREVGRRIRLLVGLSEGALARRAKKREAGEGLPSGDRSRHRRASVPGVGYYWSHSNSE